MSEPYTPTDEDMRKRHRWAWELSEIARYDLNEADAQWLRWLEAHDERVRAEALELMADEGADCD